MSNESLFVFIPILVAAVLFFIIVCIVLGIDNNERKKQLERSNWKEEIGPGIENNNCYVDKHGYLRWNTTHRLCHRDIAWENLPHRRDVLFRDCDVHHKDGNKFNNIPSNLEILTRYEHMKRHGYEESKA